MEHAADYGAVQMILCAMDLVKNENFLFIKGEVRCCGVGGVEIADATTRLGSDGEWLKLVLRV